MDDVQKKLDDGRSLVVLERKNWELCERAVFLQKGSKASKEESDDDTLEYIKMYHDIKKSVAENWVCYECCFREKDEGCKIRHDFLEREGKVNKHIIKILKASITQQYVHSELLKTDLRECNNECKVLKQKLHSRDNSLKMVNGVLFCFLVISMYYYQFCSE